MFPHNTFGANMLFSFFKSFLVLLIFQSISLFSEDALLHKIQEGIPKWMEEQINSDLKCFKENSISISSIENIFNKDAADWFLAKFTISGNQVSVERKVFHPWIDYRVEILKNALKVICGSIPMPDLVFLVSMHDGLEEEMFLCSLCAKKRMPPH